MEAIPSRFWLQLVRAPGQSARDVLQQIREAMQRSLKYALLAVMLLLVGLEVWHGRLRSHLAQRRGQHSDSGPHRRGERWLRQIEGHLWEASMALQHSAPVGLPETLQGDVAHANASPESPTGLGQLHAVVDILKRPSQVKELVPHGLEIRCMLSATRQMHDQMLDYDISGA